MLDIGWTELLLIAVVAIVIIGPNDLPRAMRFIGQWAGKMKRIARDFQGQFNDAIREAELDSVKKDVEAIGKIDPIADLRKEATKTGDEIRKGIDEQPPPADRLPPRAAAPKAAAPDAAAPKAADAPPPAVVEEPAPAAGDVKS